MHMGVMMTYNQHHFRITPDQTFDRMLEEWYEKTVSSLSPSEAVKELERILEVTCPTSVCEIVRNTGTTGGEFIQS